MRVLRFTRWALPIAVITVILSGCDNNSAGSSAAPDPDAAAGVTATAQDHPTDEAATAEPAAPPENPDGIIEGNVITRSLPRFHDAFESDGAFLNWVESFYIHKQFDRTPQAIGYYCSSPLYEDAESRIAMSDFFGSVLKQSDETVDLCYDELMLEGRENELMVLGFAAWFANTPHSRQMIYRAREVWKERNLVRMFYNLHQAKIVDSMDRPVEQDPRAISMLWSEYFATGDVDRMRKAVLHSYMFNAPEGAWQRAAGELSHPQLVRTLPYDPLVRRVVEEEAAGNPMTAIRTHLTMLLQEAGPLRERPGTPATP